MGLEIVGAPNVAIENAGGVFVYGNISHPEASSSFALENLLAVEPSRVWRSYSLNPRYCLAGVTLSKTTSSTSAEVAADAVCIVNHNLRRGSGEWRVVGLNDGFPQGQYVLPQELVPTGLVSSFNTTGTYTDVDEGADAAPDGSWIVPTSTGGSLLHVNFSFNTPTTTPRTGSGYQVFAVYARRAGAGTPVSYYDNPTITAKLYESGGAVATLGTKYVTSSSGQWLFWVWDAALLGTASGANVECRLECPTNSLKWVEIGSVSWFSEGTEFTSGTYGADVEFDSGWQAGIVDLGSLFGAYYPAQAEPRSTIFYRDSTAGPIQTVLVFFRDDQTPTDPDAGTDHPTAPVGYVEAGTLVVGATFAPSTYVGGIDLGPMLGILDLSDKRYTDGGQTDGVNRPRLRVLRVPLSYLSKAEAHALYERLYWRRGRLAPFVVRLTDDAIEGKHTTIYGTLEEPGDLIVQRTGPAARGLSFSVVEYL